MTGTHRAAAGTWISLPGAVTFRASPAKRFVGWVLVLLGVSLTVAGAGGLVLGSISPGILLLPGGLLVVAEGWSSIVTRIEVSPFGVRSWDPPARHTVERGAITDLSVSGEFLGESRGRILVGLRAGGPVALPSLFVWARGRRSQEKSRRVAAEMAGILRL